MTNSEIIYKAALAHGFTEDQLLQLLEAYKGDLPFHTFQEWKARGYSVKKGEHAIFTADLWKYTSNPSRAMVEAAKEAGKDAPEESPHYYKKLSHLFSFSQVERTKTAKKMTRKADGHRPPLVQVQPPEQSGGRSWAKTQKIKFTGGSHHEHR